MAETTAPPAAPPPAPVPVKTSAVVAFVIHALGGSISIAAAFMSAWIFNKVPGVAQFETKQHLAALITTAIVFVVTAVVAWIMHQRVAESVLAWIEINVLHLE